MYLEYTLDFRLPKQSSTQTAHEHFLSSDEISQIRYYKKKVHKRNKSIIQISIEITLTEFPLCSEALFRLVPLAFRLQICFH